MPSIRDEFYGCVCTVLGDGTACVCVCAYLCVFACTYLLRTKATSVNNISIQSVARDCHIEVFDIFPFMEDFISGIYHFNVHTLHYEYLTMPLIQVLHSGINIYL